MNLFNRKRIPDITAQPNSNSRVEIEIAKTASSDAAQKAKQVNEHVRDLLEENGFTLKRDREYGYKAWS